MRGGVNIVYIMVHVGVHGYGTSMTMVLVYIDDHGTDTL